MVQQLQLFGGRIHLLAVHQQLVAVQIDLQLVEHQTLAGIVGDLAAAQHGVDAGHQLLHLEGLDQIVVGAHLQTGDAVVDLAFSRQHDDGCLGLFPDVGADGPAVHHRQHDIQQHHVRRLPVVLLHGLAAVIGDADVKALLLQIHPDQVGNIAVILDHQNIACHRKPPNLYTILPLYPASFRLPEHFVNWFVKVYHTFGRLYMPRTIFFGGLGGKGGLFGYFVNKRWHFREL